MADLREYNCKRCGGRLQKHGDIYRCESCNAEFTDDSEAIAKALDERREREIANLRALLYDAVREKYQDDEKIRSLCREIKKYLPNDFQANFYDIAASTSGDRLNAFLLGMDVEEYAMFVPDVVEFVLRSLEKSNVTYLKALVERAFFDEDRTKYFTRIEEEAEKVDLGIYVPSLTRNVFVAHSSADYTRVLPIVEKLEARGITCFVAQRNLRHGRGAVADYGKNLEIAMRSTQCFLFFSSKNSRKPDCEALTREIPYVRDHLPRRARIEYLLDDYGEGDRAIKNTLSHFFNGKEYCRTQDDLAARLYAVIMGGEEENKPAVKYCSACGKEIPAVDEFCGACGSSEFFATKEEYYTNKAKKEISDTLARQQRELEEKLQKERKAHDEALKKERERAEAAEAEARRKQEEAARMAEEARIAKEKAEREAEEAKARAREQAKAAKKEAAVAAAKQQKESAKESRRQARREFFDNIGGIFSNIGGGVGTIARKIGEVCSMVGVTTLMLITIALGLFNFIFPLTNYIWYGDILSVLWYCTMTAEVVFAVLTLVLTVKRMGWEFGFVNGILGVGMICLIVGGICGHYGFWISFGFSIAFTAMGGVALLVVFFVRITERGYKRFTGMFPVAAVFFLILGIFGGVIWGTNQCDGMSDQFCYKLLDDGTVSAYVIEYHDSVLEFPAELDGNKVTQIEQAWSGGGNDQLEELILPEGVERIYFSAFENCTSLKSVTVREKSFVWIYDHAFKNCTSLEEVNAGKEGTAKSVFLREGAFEGCSSLKKIAVSGSVPARAFYGCSSLTHVSAGYDSSDWTVGEEAFAYSGITSFDFGGKLTFIGKESFKGSAITAVELEGTLEVGERAFEDCTKLKTVKFGLETLPERLFRGCTGLTSVSLDLQEIPEGAFENCTSLAEVSFGAKLQKIGQRAFAGSGLKTLEINDKFVSIGSFAFSGCKSLETATIDCEMIPNNAFSDCTALRELIIGENVYSVEKYAFENTTALQTVLFSERLETVGERAFKNCGLSALELENRQLNLGNSVFEGCQQLTSVNLSCNTLGERAFRECKKLTEVKIDCSVISKSAFASCEKLTSVETGSYVVTIKDTAFEKCTSLQTVTLKGGTVEAGAFKNSGGPRTLTAENTSFADKALKDMENLRTLSLTGGGVGPNAFENCKNLREATLNCGGIGSEAFLNCSSLQSITIGENCRSIGARAFEGCEHLTSAVFVSPSGWQYLDWFWWSDIDLSDASRAANQLKQEAAPSFQKNN